ncbi:uncharacterized protein CANTADRAFT_110116 [Suhomyces tanzawaensis NRRL Y-17324]|uniref:Uncharacterized protein n=1 Tax=Suhomyces tanzawaensis NRRL Y-17324 TaxID=984487 RepID=A0A1E4SPS3_9ASCO|nr:uncharacterized protein CANTADRAFT_110116 [Suhomyces tanzawaensis NRRL Y-17324]ODV81496.1 hypothetical protein CANTADRAFT_110116 [Suhomyces tanzawaensis NRRL Y-17324]
MHFRVVQYVFYTMNCHRLVILKYISTRVQVFYYRYLYFSVFLLLIVFNMYSQSSRYD